MPRHTHPRDRGGHSRAHIRAARERMINRRLNRLADERLVLEISDQRVPRTRTSWREPNVPPLPPLSKEQAAPILRECRRLYYGQSGKLPSVNGLSRRLFLSEGHTVDLWDCGCKKCMIAEEPRSRRKRRDSEEAARQLSDEPERWPKAAPARPARCRHTRKRRVVTYAGTWSPPEAPAATMHTSCVDCGKQLARPVAQPLTHVQADIENAVASPSRPLRRLIGLHGWPAALSQWKGPSPGWAPWSAADRRAAMTYAIEILPRCP